MTDPTQPLPPQPGQPPQGGQPPRASQPRASQPQASQPQASQPVAPPPPGGPPAEPGRPNLWRRATSTTGGLVATIAALVLTGLLLLGVFAAGVFALARAGERFADREDRVSELREGRGGMGQRGDDEMMPGNPNGRGNGERMMPGVPGGGDGRDGRDGPGAEDLRGLVPGLGSVEHGEFTTTGSDGKALVMTVQRGEVTAASDTSLAVRSSDDYAATYVLADATRVTGRQAGDPATGDSVLVLARKDDKVAVRVMVLSAAS